MTVAKTFKNREEAMGWLDRADPQAPKVADVAPDFELRDVKGENPVRLSDFQGEKPVALVFGSYT